MPSMRSLLPLLAAVTFGFAGCSGGGSSGSLGGAFRLASCNLGCSSTGCAVTEIAENQPIELVFSDLVDPASVNGATFVLQTPSGDRPAGQTLVDGNVVRFVPSLSLSGGSSSFGFKRNATYVLTVAGSPAEQTIRSRSGASIAQTISCSLTVTRPPIDLDGAPPVSKLESPQNGAVGVPPNVTIIVSFSELLDAAAFSGVNAATSPIQYRIRKTRDQGGQRICDQNSQPVTLVGVPILSVRAVPGGGFVSVVEMQPQIAIPSLTCVEVEVTKRVKDLAGTPATPALYTFISRESVSADQPIVEAFASDTNMDKDFSGGTWGNGEALPGKLGGDGRHGEFNLTDLTVISQGIYQLDTTNQRIPGSRTLSGRDELVNDGQFFYSSFKIPADTTVRVVGSQPLRLYVRGRVEIAGRLELNAPTVPAYSYTNALGQPGGLGLAGGAAGGKGADPGDGIANQARFNGQPGLDAKLLAGHPYAAQAAGTGGLGSAQFPASGRNSDVTYGGYFQQFSAMLTAGGAGGGLLTVGAQGKALWNNTNPVVELGPPSTGGKQFNLLDSTQFPLPPSNPGTRNLEFFLVGGSGGGGGGTHPHFSAKGTLPQWRPGSGGAGGGGAIAIRTGRDIALTAVGRIETLGGSGSRSGAPHATPGGGGSGGSILIQQDGTQPSQFGTLSVLGGKGGVAEDRGEVYALHTVGGDGAGGLARLELPLDNPNTGLIGTVEPPATAQNVGKLTDADLLSGAQSRWYPSRQFFPPDWIRYEIEAVVGTQTVRYSDDPAKGILAQDGQAVRFYVQGARVSPNGEPDSSSIKPWRKYVGAFTSNPALAGDDATGFRFQVVFDRTIDATVKLKKVTLYFRG